MSFVLPGPLMISWCLGGLLALVVFGASSLLIAFKLLISPRLLPKLPDLLLPEPVSKNLIMLQTFYQV
jgi:hypothetical protein